MAHPNILVEREDKIAIVTIHRPQVMNALSAEALGELERVVDELDADSTVRAVIFTGAGDKAFVAGADLREFPPTNAEEGRAAVERVQNLFFRIERLSKPVIMAINGFAVGGGCELAMAGDIRIASERAQLGQPEIDLGILPGWGGTQRLPRLVGKGMAKYLIFSGERLSAQEAQRIGLVDFVVPPDELMAEAKALARKLAEKPRIAMALAKKAIEEGLEVDLERGCVIEAAYFGLTCATQDRIEGVNAFLEKRRPHFIDR